MVPPSSLRSLPPREAECRGSKSACANLDGTRAGCVSQLAVSPFGTAGRD
jgi:hypothetical protein